MTNIYARRGTQVQLDGLDNGWWRSPSIGLGYSIVGDTPPVFSGTQPWLTPVWSRVGGQEVIDPGPNTAYTSAGGSLHLRSDYSGWCLITKQTFPRLRYCSLEWVASAKAMANPPPDAFMSAGFYNGEADYRTFNYMQGTQQNKLALTVLQEPLHTAITVADNYCWDDGHNTVFRMDCEGGLWRYFADGNLLREDNSGPLANDPHICVFIGGMTGILGRMTLNIE